MPNDIILTEVERSLIAAGASVAAGCQPCTAYHIKAASAAGACPRSVSLAVETALTGRQSATAVMEESAARCQGERPEIDAAFRERKRLMVELTSVATAVAVNSVPDLKRHFRAARESGASEEQLQAAVEVARQIQRTAQTKIDDALSELAPRMTSATAGAGCCGSDSVTREVAAGPPTGCGCR